MSELWKLIQAHLDEYGVRDAALARRMGTAPQTLNSWKKRGMKQLPSRDLIEALAREIRQPYEVVLGAILSDLQYLSDKQLEEVTSGIHFGVRPAKGDQLEVTGMTADGGDLDPARDHIATMALDEDPALLASILVSHLAKSDPEIAAAYGDTPEEIHEYFRDRFALNPAEVEKFLAHLTRGISDDAGPATSEAGATPANVTELPQREQALDPPRDVAARRVRGRSTTQAARQRQDEDAER